jgi:hypothetical protein
MEKCSSRNSLQYKNPAALTTFMQIQYEIIFRVDLGKAIPEINEIMESLNADIARAGHDEKLMLTHEGIIPPMIVTVDRELTMKEQDKMNDIILEVMRNRFQKLDVRVSSFRRKSGNVQQSASSAA